MTASQEKRAKEKEREKKGKVRRSQEAKNAAWSEKVEKRTVRDKRKEKKVRKREWLNAQEATEKNGGDELGQKRKSAPDDKDDDDEGTDDWNELAKEERMAKKVKQGKTTAEVFDEAFMDL